jgi:hypothetical protein
LLLASLELERVAEWSTGGLLLVVALAWGGLIVLPRWRARRAAQLADPGTPALARFADAETADPEIFGGGAARARVRRRRDTVAYGYPAAAEEYADPETGTTWCTLTVSLPGRVPFLVADHWSAVGQPGVPHAAPQRPRLGDPAFDSAYVVGVEDAEVAARLLSPAARRLLVERPVQRLKLRGSSLVVRSADGIDLDGASLLGDIVARFLASTPSFVRSSMAATGRLRPGDPLPEGLTGPDSD